jgi:membrane-associated protease RseP (regulator of RpoE activity)
LARYARSTEPSRAVPSAGRGSSSIFSRLAPCASRSYIVTKMLNPSALTELATALGGLPILGCHTGSPAERAGIRYGDILLSINGRQTASWSDFFQAHTQSTGATSVRVLRQGIELVAILELPPAARTPRELLEARSS